MIIATHYVGNATITLAIDGIDSEMPHKSRIAYSVKLPYVPGSEAPSESGRGHIGADLTIVTRDSEAETLASAYESLLSFLGAAAESYPDGENADLFPADVTQWAHQYADELALAQLEMEEALNAEEDEESDEPDFDRPVTSVWSSYGHTFMSTGESASEDGRSDYERCLTCGAQYVLRNLGDGRGEYVNGTGEAPHACSGRIDLVHGYERICEADNGRECETNAQTGTCAHVDHVCDCVLCD